MRHGRIGYFASANYTRIAHGQLWRCGGQMRAICLGYTINGLPTTGTIPLMRLHKPRFLDLVQTSLKEFHLASLNTYEVLILIRSLIQRCYFTVLWYIFIMFYIICSVLQKNLTKQQFSISLLYHHFGLSPFLDYFNFSMVVIYFKIAVAATYCDFFILMVLYKVLGSKFYLNVQ